MNECWIDIEEYENHYQISDKGRVKSLSRTLKDKNGKSRKVRERILKHTINNGYCYITLHPEPLKTFLIHRLVMQHFHKKSELEVNHIDGDKTNNTLDNLEYVTPQENIEHAIKTGLVNRSGENNNFNKLSEVQVLIIIDALNRGERCATLSRQYGVSGKAIELIKNGKNWKHLTKGLLCKK